MRKSRICELCGKEFTPKGSKDKYCKSPVVKICSVCGKEFTSICHPKASSTCDNPDCKRRAGSVASHKAIRRLCRVCGQPFDATAANQQDCGREIVRKCKICGAEFRTKCSIYFDIQTCNDPHCRGAYAHQQSQAFYSNITKQCVLCGKDFHPTNNTQSVCNGEHFGTCKICGKTFPIYWKSGMNLNDLPKTCSTECKTKASFANGNPAKSQISKDKAKHTNLIRYGVEHPMHNPDIKAKIVQTNRNRYGADYFVQTDAYVEKSIATNRDRYGTDWARQNPEIQKKSEDTLFSHYGVTNPSDSLELLQKRVENYRELTGYDNPGQNPKVKDKIKQTVRDRYGVDYTSQIPAVKAKVADTMLKRYGGTSALNSPILREKIKETNRKKYGYDNPTKSPIVQAKISDTMMKRYGATRHNASWEYRQSIMTDPTKIDEWKSFLSNPEQYISEHFDHKPNYRELSDILGVNDSSIQVHLARQGKSELVKYTLSYYEDDLVSILHQINSNMQIVRHNRNLIAPYEIDVYLPEYNLGIEMNPTGTHNSSFGSHDNDPKAPSYHRMKTELCEKQGVFLFHIFGYEWTHKQEIIISMLRNLVGCNTSTIYARKCIIKPVSGKDAYEFLQKNHRQGGVHSKIRYGLYFNDELVSLMTFGKIRNTMGSGNEDLSDCWELVRFCNKLNTSVVGGASRLFKHFIAHHNPIRVRSFSDRAHTKGNLYQTLGFIPIHTNDESYVWVDLSDNRAYSRVTAQKHNLKKFLKDDMIDLGQTEREIMEAHGYARVFDSGTITWEWTSA